ncbi:hypothetical protein CWI42_042090 [Ordospora colligata]|uniref:Uncharacterized protein n=1 Tax=Ordospora colligata OC4 TaxID=1354746 RepID=A0A0B2ULZ4_9MICR|nr:uncharacterized protein M896_042100 [Ordospora colligata OC4]KHN70010.1 hypothetical protein M896_042100 [Ordospora colligata OC4]TBU16180.1 hypothetical protein CWI41_042090 [Ordospora colligata]TBU16393.1 hypothetical protein CWI40_042090 [Ordospora colligata]TBU19097.1 hypothetical protein CWI42_042090 [Ordospora colligata]
MGLCLDKIEESIAYMDETYDANFGDWIRNEDNARIVAYNMRKYVDCYKPSDFIIVVKWIVKDWTLKSIIIFSKKMLIEDLKALGFRKTDDDKSKYNRRAKIVSGLVYTWNPVFITEFVISVTRSFTPNEKCRLLTNMLEIFEPKKISEILSQLETKIDQRTWNELFKTFNADSFKTSKQRIKRTASMLRAYNIGHSS